MTGGIQYFQTDRQTLIVWLFLVLKVKLLIVANGCASTTVPRSKYWTYLGRKCYLSVSGPARVLWLNHVCVIATVPTWALKDRIYFEWLTVQNNQHLHKSSDMSTYSWVAIDLKLPHCVLVVVGLCCSCRHVSSIFDGCTLLPWGN